jgi:hypothetical protein
MSSLHRRSYGIIMLLLALVAIAPGISIVAGLLLMIPAFQMLMGKSAPVFPPRIAAHPFPTRHLAALVIALISLAYLEEDGLLLSIALLAAVIVLIVELVVIWGSGVLSRMAKTRRRKKTKTRPALRQPKAANKRRLVVEAKTPDPVALAKPESATKPWPFFWPFEMVRWWMPRDTERT